MSHVQIGQSPAALGAWGVEVAMAKTATPPALPLFRALRVASAWCVSC